MKKEWHTKKQLVGQLEGSGEIAIQDKFRSIAEQFQSDFIGYDNLKSSSVILGLYESDGTKRTSISKGESGIMVTDITPFILREVVK